MSKSNFEDVLEFHAKFDLLPTEPGPRALPKSLQEFRERFMREELGEFWASYRAGENGEPDVPGLADALVDLVYVALGTAVMMGLPWPELWDAVHAANMTKVRAQAPADSKRGSTFDVVKPAGWVAPDVAGIIARARGGQNGPVQAG